MGKYSDCFAGVQTVIAFKFYSNTSFEKFNTAIYDFALQAADTGQIAGYMERLKQEYPQAKISQHVIYCFSDQGFLCSMW